MIKNENYITIQGWMKNILGLSGNKLIVFSIIFGFCQDKESEYKGGVKYISEWIGCSAPTTISILKKLCDSGVISKREVINEKGRFVYYRVEKGFNDGLLNNLNTPVKNLNYPIVKNFNNPYNIEEIINNINNNKIKELIQQWVAYKKERKESYTPSGLKKCIERLENLCHGDEDYAEEIVGNSMANNYAGLYAPKEKKQKESVFEHNMRVMKQMEEENANESLF